ncbi:quinoprotein relay system zinc metallohydrolase 2 [Methylosoma difficile]
MAAPVLSVTEVAAGVYMHQGVQEISDTHNHGAIANIGFIVGERCVAVVDTGGNPEQGLALKNAIAHVTDKPVCYVINTHVHPDHIYGNAAFKGAGVQFVGHEKLARAMSARGQFYLDKAEAVLAAKISAHDIVPPDIEVANRVSLDLGGRLLEIRAHRTAHTDNDVSVYDAKTDTMWLSDLLFLEHIPVIDGSLKGWLAELEILEKQAYKTVIPGHGRVVTDWPKSMQPEKAYLQGLLTDIRAAIKNGVYLEDALKTVGQGNKSNWLFFEEFHRKNATTAFAELEWED